MRLVLATRNRDKVSEIRRILEGLDVQLTTLEEFGDVPETVEDGATLEANALKKAREVRDFTGRTALADDTGLEVDALDGAPGIRAARYAGEGASYDDNCDKLLSALEGVPQAKRTAKFRTVIAVALESNDADKLNTLLSSRPHAAGTRRDAEETIDALVSEGILPGRITEEKHGSGGFGYDPVFFDPNSGRTLAEMSPAEKNTISHRYRALIEMRELLLRLGLANEVS